MHFNRNALMEGIVNKYNAIHDPLKSEINHPGTMKLDSFINRRQISDHNHFLTQTHKQYMNDPLGQKKKENRINSDPDYKL